MAYKGKGRLTGRLASDPRVPDDPSSSDLAAAGVFGGDPAFRDEAPIPTPRTVAEAMDMEEEDVSRWPVMCRLSEEVETRLVRWLDDELQKCYVERDGLLKDWRKWQEQYLAVPEFETKDFPFTGASTVVVPLTAIAVEAVHARLMTTLFAVEPFWSIRPRASQWVRSAKPVEEWLQYEVEHNMKIYPIVSSMMMELCKLGTVVGKVTYVRDIRKTYRHVGGEREAHYYDKHDGPKIDHVPLANFLLRLAETDVQEAAWVGEEHQFTWAQLKRMSQTGQFMREGVEAIRKHWVDVKSSELPGQGENKEEMNRLLNIDEHWFEVFKTQEIWASFDVDEDGEDEEIVLDYHFPSRTILSVRYNWNSDCRRPYRVCQYLKVENRIFGLGIGKQNEQFQIEATAIHRQRLDNATIANMRMVIAHRSSTLKPGEPLFPGKIVLVDDIKHVNTIQLGEVYPSSYNNEDIIVRYSEKRTGVNEVLLGQPAQGTPGTATDALTRLAEGNKRFDVVMQNVRWFFGELGQDTLMCFQDFGPSLHHWFVQEGTDAQHIDRVISLPPLLVAKGTAVELTVTSSAVNKQVEQQQWLALFKLIVEYYGQVIGVAAQFAPQVALMYAQRALMAADEAMRQLLATFDVQNPEKFVFTEPADGGENGGEGAGGDPLRTLLLQGMASSQAGGSAAPAGGSNGASGQPAGRTAIPSGSPARY